MEKIVKKQLSVFKKILIVLGILVGLPIVIVVFLLAIQPIVDGIDHSKFMSLNNQTRSIYNDIQKASAGVDDWKYETKCIDTNANFFGPADYLCSTTIILVAPVSSAVQVQALHDKYYPIINGSKSLKPMDNLSEMPPAQFGVDFVMSSIDRQYKSSDGYKCEYSTKLGQSHEEGLSYGTPIMSNIGQTTVILDCSGKASGDWYKN